MTTAPPPPAGALAPAVLVVRSPAGTVNRVRVDHVPFRIGRHGDNDLVLRDNRASRHHAEITAANGAYIIDDLGSSYGVFVNGERVTRARLGHADRIEFGFPDSYQLTFELATSRPPGATAPAVIPQTPGSSLSKLRATLEVARALQASLSTDEVLSAVVEAALTITGCDRGFLLLRHGDDLQIRIARSRSGPLDKSELRVPTRLLRRALDQRRDFLSMNFDPNETVGAAERSIYDLELRSIVCVPLVRIRTGAPTDTGMMSPANDTTGLLYMDSRLRSADLSGGSRELLTTLVLEASTILENARLLEEQWAHQRMDQELLIAREIQQSLMPRALPSAGWLRAAATSTPSLQVGGDYVDVRQTSPECWATIMADVSGKGVGAAILASLLQGMFVASPYTRLTMEEMMGRVNRFLYERTCGEQYATAFYCTLDRFGGLHWINAGHPPPVLLRYRGRAEMLEASGLPLGMMDEGTFPATETQLTPGDVLVIYTDGVLEAQNSSGEFFGLKRLRETVLAHAAEGAQNIHAAVWTAIQTFTGGAPQRDDLTLAVVEYGFEG